MATAPKANAVMRDLNILLTPIFDLSGVAVKLSIPIGGVTS